MTNAERQKRYRDGKRNAPVPESVSFSPAGVTGRPKNVTRVTADTQKPPQSVTESESNVTENPVSSEIPRENGISAPVTATPDSESETRIASVEDYHAHPEDYAERACAALLNWGPWMSPSELKDARLSGNRIPLPGDWDYVASEAVASKTSCYL